MGGNNEQLVSDADKIVAAREVEEIRTKKKRRLKRPPAAVKKLGVNEIILSLNCLQMPCEYKIQTSLPPDILEYIFLIVVESDETNAVMNLVRLSQACDSFRELIASSTRLWKYVDLSDFQYVTAERDLLNLFKLGIFNRVEKLNLSGFILENTLNKFLNSCADTLKEIVFRDSVIDDESLQLLTDKGSSLESIDFSRISPIDKVCSTTIKKPRQHHLHVSSLVSLVVRRGKQLKEVNLSGIKVNSFGYLSNAIMSNCANLRLLDLSNMFTTSVCRINLKRLNASCPLLKVLRLANVALEGCKEIPESSFIHLEELSVPLKTTTCDFVIEGHSDEAIAMLTRQAEKLCLLDIRGSKRTCLVELLLCPAANVQNFSLSGFRRINESVLELVIEKWKHSLVDLDMTWIDHEKPVCDSLNVLCERGNSSLRNITLKGSSVSLPALRKLFENCEKLEFIDLQSCKGLPRGIKRTFAGSQLNDLKRDVINGLYDYE